MSEWVCIWPQLCLSDSWSSTDFYRFSDRKSSSERGIQLRGEGHDAPQLLLLLLQKLKSCQRGQRSSSSLITSYHSPHSLQHLLRLRLGQTGFCNRTFSPTVSVKIHTFSLWPPIAHWNVTSATPWLSYYDAILIVFTMGQGMRENTFTTFIHISHIHCRGLKARDKEVAITIKQGQMCWKTGQGLSLLLSFFLFPPTGWCHQGIRFNVPRNWDQFSHPQWEG